MNERARRQEAERVRREQREEASEASVRAPSASTAAADRPLERGRRLSGQELACAWCGGPVQIRARGPIPKWCSATCRHRAWEQQRAARSGQAAVQVVDRMVAAVPADGRGWIDQLEQLISQLAAPDPIADQHLDQLAAALRAALAAVAERGRRRDTARAMWERY